MKGSKCFWSSFQRQVFSARCFISIVQAMCDMKCPLLSYPSGQWVGQTLVSSIHFSAAQDCPEPQTEDWKSLYFTKSNKNKNKNKNNILYLLLKSVRSWVADNGKTMERTQHPRSTDAQMFSSAAGSEWSGSCPDFWSLI